jgi:signal transduction histidine kinase
MESKKYVTELERKYETTKKELQIQHLETEKKISDLVIKRKNIINFVLIGGIFWILLVSYLIYRNLKHRQRIQQHRIQELENEKQLMAAEAVLKGEEQERTRIAKDLHDGLGGMLSGLQHSFNTMKGNLIMTPENHQAFERGMDMLDSSIKEMRRVAHNMMPEALVRFGLDTSLKDFCNDINQSGTLHIEYQSLGMENTELEQSISITIYRIVQELINNILKHANASTAIVQLIRTAGKLTVTVEDNGQGFDTAILNSSKGIGWMNIRNRVNFLKGTLDITSRKDEGTSVQIELTV